jgi:uncharacterized protein (TIGR03437 family)
MGRFAKALFLILLAPATLSAQYTISVFAGSGRTDFSGDNGPATNAGLTLSKAAGIAVDRVGNVYIADGAARIRKVDASGTITTFAGGGTKSPATGVKATDAGFLGPVSVATDSAGNVYFAGPNIFLIDSSGLLKSVATPGNISIAGLATDSAGNVYYSDPLAHNWVQKISPSGGQTTVAGTGTGGFSGDNGPGASAQLSQQEGVAVDSAGNVYIADTFNHRIRKVDTSGIITTVAGTGKADYSGDGGPATGAALDAPAAVAVDAAGNLFITDNRNNVIRKVDTKGIITTVAGNGKPGESGDGGPALSAQMFSPYGIAVDSAGRIFFADQSNSRVRVLTPSTTTPPATPATISSLSPATVAAGGTGFALSVFGSNFATGASVRWNSVALSSTVVNSTQMAATVPASLIAASGTATVNVVNPGAAASNPLTFTISPQAGCTPTGLFIQAIAPQSGFSAVVGQAVNLQVAISDNCGTPVLTGKGSAVLATFSNNDPSLALSGVGSGRWAATWTPSGGQGAVVVVEVSAFEALGSGTILGGKVDITGFIQSSAPAALLVTPASLTFSLSQGGQSASQPVSVVNEGAQTANFTATTSTSWLSVSPASGTAAPGAPGILTVTANTGTLAPGTYTGAVGIQSGGVVLPPVTVTMTVSAAQPILLLSQAGLSFRSAQGGGAPLPQDFGILNIGQGVLNWTVQASTLSGTANWLSVSPGSGTVTRPYLDVSLVNVAVDPTSLAAGTYYGQIRVSASGVSNSPQSISVVLTVLPAGTNPGPEVRPTGLIFAGPQSANPAAQGVTIGNTGVNPSKFGSAPVLPPNTGAWFSYTPGTSTVGTGKAVPLNIQPDFSSLAPGATRGAIALLFDDGTIANVALLAVVPPTGTQAPEKGELLPRANGCTPNQLNIQPTGPPINTTLGQPVTMEVRIVDSCAVDLTSSTSGAAVRVSFSNGDTAVPMFSMGSGRWSATWQPQRVSPSGTYVATITAFEVLPNGVPFGNQIDIPVTLNGRGDVPIVSAGVFNAASFLPDTPVAPGSLLTIFGSKLATGSTGQAGQQPYPSDLGGTEVLLGGKSLPLLYASDGQINAQAPYDLPLNVPTQIVVQRSGALSVPQTVSVAPAQPAVFTKDQSGHGQGVIVNGITNQLADGGAPVKAGDIVVIYCTGLGAVNPSQAPGTAATGPTPTVQPVSVTIGGQNASVAYAGLTPGYAGLYQVNATVPDGVTAGSAVPVVLSTAGQTSPPVTIVVR